MGSGPGRLKPVDKNALVLLFKFFILSAQTRLPALRVRKSGADDLQPEERIYLSRHKK